MELLSFTVHCCSPFAHESILLDLILKMDWLTLPDTTKYHRRMIPFSLCLSSSIYPPLRPTLYILLRIINFCFVSFIDYLFFLDPFQIQPAAINLCCSCNYSYNDSWHLRKFVDRDSIAKVPKSSKCGCCFYYQVKQHPLSNS